MEANGIHSDAKFPLVVKRRNGTATIYKRERVKNGRDYVEFRLGMFDADGKRTLTNFATLDKAIRAAEAQLDAIGRGLVEVTTLSGPARLDYHAARGMLPGHVTLADAARAWLKAQESPRVAPIPVPDAVAAFIASRETGTRRGGPASAIYLLDLSKRLGKLAAQFPADHLDALTSDRLESWADGLGLRGRNRFNSFRLVKSLLRWAQKRGHVAEGKLATDSLDIHRGEEGAIQIFSPQELAKIFAVARPVIVPYLALAAFGGLRTAEIRRLDWADLKLERGFVEVSAAKAKTRSRRLVPVLPALLEWLVPIRKQTGPLLPFTDIGRQTSILARDSGIPWKHNALRHSFVSYRLAMIQNVDQVALECGNSPAMIFANYRELVTPAEAEAWFGVRPAGTTNVLPFAVAGDAREAAAGA